MNSAKINNLSIPNQENRISLNICPHILQTINTLSTALGDTTIEEIKRTALESSIVEYLNQRPLNTLIAIANICTSVLQNSIIAALVLKYLLKKKPLTLTYAAYFGIEKDL